MLANRVSALLATTFALTTLSAGLAFAAPPDPDSGAAVSRGDTEDGPTLAPTASKPVTAAEVPIGCELSPYHSIFDEQVASAENLVKLGWSASAAGPVDPTDSNYNLRAANLSVTNPSKHTFYQSVYFVGWVYVSRTNSSSGPWNYAAWDQANGRFQTGFDPDYPDGWSWGWYPRDPSIPGAVVRYVDSTYPAQIFTPSELGYDHFGSETRPGYLITDDIAPGASLSWSQMAQVERPTGTGFYAYLTYRYLTTRTCLPVPTIATIPALGPTVLSGTGTTAGDTIKVTDLDGNLIGTAVVDDSLNWTLQLDSPLDEAITEVKVIETDEFGFTGTTSTKIPVPTPTPTPSSTEPTSTASPTSSPTSTVKSETDTDDDDLASTGAGNFWPLLGVGTLAILAGGALLFLRGRRGSAKP